jgi:aldehyde dehydrogenase (NAD+)
VKALLSDSRLQGHKFAVGGEEGADEPGYFVPISIIDNPPHDSRIVKEEQFGPILPVIRFTDIDDAISLANDSEYGLAASVWSNDAALAARVAERLDAGTVWINEVQYLSPFAPFGGHKQSGIGSENGVEGLMEYTRPKTVTYLKPKNTHETGKK